MSAFHTLTDAQIYFALFFAASLVVLAAIAIAARRPKTPFKSIPIQAVRTKLPVRSERIRIRPATGSFSTVTGSGSRTDRPVPHPEWVQPQNHQAPINPPHSTKSNPRQTLVPPDTYSKTFLADNIRVENSTSAVPQQLRVPEPQETETVRAVPSIEATNLPQNSSARPDPGESAKSIVSNQISIETLQEHEVEVTHHIPSDVAVPAEAPKLRQSKPEPVSFTVAAPAVIPGDHYFEIEIEIEKFLERPTSDDGTSSETSSNFFETLVAEIRQGSRVGLVMECLPAPGSVLSKNRCPILIDTPYQALSWGSRKMVAVFSARSRPITSEISADCIVWITADGLELGALDFEICLRPFATPVVRATVATSEQINSASIRTAASIAMSRATMFQRAFICYSHQDSSRVGRYIEVLDATNLNYLIDVLDLKRSEHWLSQVSDWIRTVDIVYIFWSEAIATSTGMQKELDRIKIERKRRKLQQRAGRSKKLGVCVVKLDEGAGEPPNWLFDEGGYSKRPEAFEAFAAAEATRKAAGTR